MAYHTLGLECRSPFKNLFLNEADYLCLINNFNEYMNISPVYDHDEVDPHSNQTYPVLKLKDLYIHCNHSNDPDIAICDWERRKRKINSKNIFYMIYTENKETARTFEQICMGKKAVCFVPWETRGQFQFGIKKDNESDDLWKIVNDSASMKGLGLKYDLIDLLLASCIIQSVDEM